VAFIASKPELARRSGTALADLKAATDELRTINKKNVYMNSINTGMELFQIAAKFSSYVTSLTKDDKGNMRDPEEKDLQPMREWIGTFFKDYEANLDKDMMTALILKNAELPADQQVKTFGAIYGNKTGNERDRTVREFVDGLLEDTRLATKDGCEKLLTRDVDDVLDDEAMKLYKQYSAEVSPVSAKYQSILAKLTRLRTKYVEPVLQLKNASVSYPDANRTLRFTYGKVVDLRPRDAVAYSVSTTLTGVMEKESDTEEFLVPAKLKELWQKKDFGRYADPKLKDVPIAFISDLDITGGNSGSPVINGKGELIGCAFDGNWEGVVGDYVFEERMNRTISVDARYILFVLDKFSGAKNIMKELVIH
jgi:hypothetical protein